MTYSLRVVPAPNGADQVFLHKKGQAHLVEVPYEPGYWSDYRWARDLGSSHGPYVEYAEDSNPGIWYTLNILWDGR